MATASELDDWRRSRRQSLRALPGHAVFVLALTAVLLALHWLLGLWISACLAILALGSFSLAGDLINIIWVGRRIAQAERRQRL
jgi:hypothetical protein